jgi:hypothetical protein
MRTQSVLAAVVSLGITTALSGPMTALAASATRHDGTIEAVNPKAKTLVIWELGANAKAHAVRVHVAPTARVALSRRNPKATDAQHEFTDTPIQLSDIKRGDFVVVDETGSGARAEARSVVVTLRG